MRKWKREPRCVRLSLFVEFGDDVWGACGDVYECSSLRVK